MTHNPHFIFCKNILPRLVTIRLLAALVIMASLAACEKSFLRYSLNQQGTVTSITPAFNDDDNAASDDELEPVTVLVPKDFADGKLKTALSDIQEFGTLRSEEVDSIEIVFIISGSVYGTRCHDQGGEYHCHPNK